MDPCPFVRVLVRNLALKVPAAARPAGGPGVHPSAHPCFATVRLHNHPSRHTSPVPLVPADHGSDAPAASTALAAGFHLSKSEIDRFARTSLTLFPSAASGASTTKLKVRVYSGRRGTSCGVRSGRLLGKVSLPLDLKAAAAAEGKAVVHHSAWVGVGKGAGKAQLYLTVTSEMDPKFVFEFDAEPERSPQVFQVQDNRGRQPVFTCSFSRRHNSGDPNWRSKSLPLESSSARNWPPSLAWLGKERKGWSVTVHDLSGSPVALASMVTPFVASPGTDRVSRSNPGAWLILRPGVGTWHPWARLEAWRERGGSSGDGLGYRFQLLSTNPADPRVCLAESAVSSSRGGKFTVDLTSGSPFPRTTSAPHTGGEPTTPSSAYVGFVMSSTIAGEGRRGVGPTVEVGERHVGCAEDAAAFVAVAAAVNLSMEACRLFSNKLQRGISLSNLSLRRQSSSLI
ncbi:uncharacterized protein LOC121991750 [Zingiber officinale]|uniref:Uncharacterized protein n=1 Tax=Zingiber officinale TaxID=94328 RepID=A0A8J5FYT0_ZINOF|nr:uncharacterized protein LOC121991750 [Zingiber officinale]KAG6494699.1 hypothetical protein ZIOFF_042460 [Zingiber officinale]